MTNWPASYRRSVVSVSNVSSNTSYVRAVCFVRVAILKSIGVSVNSAIFYIDLFKIERLLESMHETFYYTTRRNFLECEASDAG